ncbi:hypothetical protein TYRP_006685 [Tyrophagus putrescentiae]|nr:hypothetical protein TYRP_006685 [Tyrophagus putrescentiae]
MTPPATPLKVLVVGNVFGKFAKLFKRVADVNAKAGPFDLLLCVGDFFGQDVAAYTGLTTGAVPLPNVPTYVLGKIPAPIRSMHPEVENFDHGFEVTEGITFLGRSGILTTSQGLRIAYLNGQHREESASGGSGDESLEYFTTKDYESLLMSQRSSAAILDILLTCQWPQDVFRYTNTEEAIVEQMNSASSDLISQLAWVLRPRYFFTGGTNYFCERTPYRNHKVLSETARNVTRFYSIADVMNAEKLKWIYAFNIVPAKYSTTDELLAQPQGVTENPFIKAVHQRTSRQSSQLAGVTQFFFAVDNGEGGSGGGGGDFGKRRRDNRNDNNADNSRPPRKQLRVDTETCWFCFASPNIDKTLIVSIGDFSYLAVAKGGLTDDHMMIVPINHIRSAIEIEEAGLRDEIAQFKAALVKFFKTRDLVPVFFERNFRSAHFQINVVGLPVAKAPALKATVADVFGKLEYHELPLDTDFADVLSPGAPYFTFECPDHYKFIVRINTKKDFFPIQIGRELLAHAELLNCPERIDWKKCASSPEEAEQLTTQIRTDFKPFDFTD